MKSVLTFLKYNEVSISNQLRNRAKKERPVNCNASQEFYSGYDF